MDLHKLRIYAHSPYMGGGIYTSLVKLTSLLILPSQSTLYHTAEATTSAEPSVFGVSADGDFYMIVTQFVQLPQVFRK